MVSRRKFLSIITMMAVLLFMFQFSQIIKNNEDEYSVNIWAEDVVPSGVDRWKPVETVGGNPLSVWCVQDQEFVLFLGRERSPIGNVAVQWCLYTKRNLVVCENPEEYFMSSQPKPEMVLLDSAVIDCNRYLTFLMEFTRQGISIVFCSLPDASVIQASEGLKELLGIQYVRDQSIEAEGIHIFGDFLLGGSYVYKAERKEDEERQDLQLRMPWYITLDGTKTYMVGMLDELLEKEEEKNELFPGVIWRNRYGSASIFAVNGNYMSDITGIGLLSAMEYEMKSYTIYPVVNAQNLLLANYPEFTDENTEAMQEVYSRSSGSLQQDIIWPAVLTTVKQNQWKITGFFLPQYDYQDRAEPSVNRVPFYLQQFREADAEAGVSLKYHKGISLEDKLVQDERFYASMDRQYAYSSALMDTADLPKLGKVFTNQFAEKIRTVACEWDSDQMLLSYYNDALTIQCIVNAANDHTWSSDIRLRSIETALGYSSVEIDMQQVIWPESKKYYWEKFYEKVASNLDTYWKPFKKFEKTTLSESDKRVRTFLNLDYASRREGEKIYLDVEGMEDESWFLLRTHGETIADIEGADYQVIEEGAYLLRILEEQVEIRLEKSQGILTYTLPDK